MNCRVLLTAEKRKVHFVLISKKFSLGSFVNAGEEENNPNDFLTNEMIPFDSVSF